MVKYKSVVFCGIMMCVAAGAAAQVPIDGKDWVLVFYGAQRDSKAVSATMRAEGIKEGVVVEHWVVRDPIESGVRFSVGRLAPGEHKYASTSEFLEAMWWQSVERDEKWFYARQTVIYSPLEEGVKKDWEYINPPVACMRLIDESGRVVGHQVRTEAWSLYTDDWVLYPGYWPMARRGAVAFIDVTEDGCEWPGDLIEREYAAAQRRRDLSAFQYATTTFALVPLKPSASSVWR